MWDMPAGPNVRAGPLSFTSLWGMTSLFLIVKRLPRVMVSVCDGFERGRR